MRTFVLLFLLSITLSGFTQKKLLIERSEEVVSAAKAEIAASMEGPEGGLYLLQQEHGLKGTYVMDIQIHEKGKVASVFCKSKENGEISHQTIIKDYIKDFSFNFKMPKGKKYKFEYTFKF
ncbi:MAG: hypothetical protein K9G76_07705 [Bacteroidales bacterium]|nr:hypothetical protein [Bacteroidales bacterium]MCF8405463.1 hypothetical protein [Bacteroidales bacterium]